MAEPFGTLKYIFLKAPKTEVSRSISLIVMLDRLDKDEQVTDKSGNLCFIRLSLTQWRVLLLALNITVRTLSNYAEKDDYFPTINRAVLSL